MPWYEVSVTLHILAACVWVGGMIFLAIVVLPILRQQEYRSVAMPLIRGAGVRFRWVGWMAVGTLVLTGIANLRFRGYGWAQLRDGGIWQGWFGHTLAAKLILVAAIVVISAVHDMLGPGAVEQLDPAAAQRFRRHAAWMGRVVLLFSIAVVALGVILVRGV
jgi:putative copper resistance protein D